MFTEDINDLIDAFKDQANYEYWSLNDWIETLTQFVDTHYKGKYHPHILNQLICQRFSKLNNNYQFRILRKRQSQLRKQLETLRAIPLNKAQKSEEWNCYRYNHINASEAQQIMTGSRNSMMYKKAAPYESGSGGQTVSLQHGNRYEPISFMIKSAVSGKKIYEFESIQHPKYDFLAASPDGIDEDGTMIEIKNPKTRTIIGAPKPDYWVQTQMQMEVCDLDQCDFVECKIDEYPCIDDYKEDTNTSWRGIILEYRIEETDPKWVYSPLNLKADELDEWIRSNKEDILNKSPNNSDGEPLFVDVIPWRLTEYSDFRVYRDRQWFAETLPKFIDFWEEVLTHRKNGTWEQIPVKRRAIKPTVEKDIQPQQCLIDEEY